MKIKITRTLFVLIIFVGGIILAKNRIQVNNTTNNNFNHAQNGIIVDSGNAIYEINSNTYTYTLYENNVSIKYPILSSNEIDLASVNKLIKETALNIFTVDKEFKQDINISYEIVFNNNKFISIIFTGLANATPSAHPRNMFYTLNIDIERGSKIKLTDIYNIDDSFIELYKSELKKQTIPYIAMYLENYTNEELKKMFNNADKENDGIFSYYTDTSVGISFPTIYAIGDHIEVEINKELLKNGK